MKVTEKKLDDGRIQLDAIASTAEVAQALTVGNRAFCQQMGVVQQQGKTLEQCAQEQLGMRDLDALSQQQAIEYLVPFAVDKRNLTPAYPPKPQTPGPIRRGQTFSFTVRVTPKPDYELSSYDPVKITVPSVEFDQSQVDQQLAQFVAGFSEYVDAEPHPIGKDDCAEIAISASQDGKELANLSTDGRTYVMGMQLMPPEFERELVGMTAGDTKTFTFPMPGAAEDDAPIECTVTVNKLQKRIVPELTDEWVAKNMPIYRDAAALRGSVESRLRADFAAQVDEMRMTAAAAELAKRFKGRIADEVYESMRDTMVSNIRGNLKQQGVTFEQFVESQGGEQQFGMMLMMQTREILVQGYALDALFRHEKLSLTDEDIDLACRAMNPQDPQTARRQMEGNGQGFALREMAQRLKANRWLLEHAEVTVEEMPAPSAAPNAADAAGEGSPEAADASVGDEAAAPDAQAE